MKDKILEQFDGIDKHHSYVFMHTDEVKVSVNGKFTDSAAYHFVLTLMRDRPEIVDAVKKYLKIGE